jgi:mitochondrial fission protein ELM1
MVSQANGLSKYLSSNVLEIKTDVIFPWNKLEPGFLPITSWVFKNQIPLNDQPDLLISCGRKSVYFSLYCKKKFQKLINIHIQNPKVSSKNFNYVISPNHDSFYGNNVINSVGALHQFEKPNKKSNPNLLTCIVGGDNQHYKFALNEANGLCKKLIEIKKFNSKMELSVITSRRTSDLVKKILIKNLNNIAKIWSGSGENPYKQAIQESSFFIVTSDSTSMISEAAISGKPIYIYHLPFIRKSKRILEFHNEFNKLGISRDLKNIKKLDKWAYNPLNESKRIAGIIKQKIIKDLK